MLVRVDGENFSFMDQFHRGPTIFEVSAQRHQIDFIGMGDPLWSESIPFGPDEVVVIQFRPPGRRPVWTASREPQWWVSRYPQTHTE